MASRIFRVAISHLHLHPHNMYQSFKADEVREMAASIRANGGVLQPLRVVPMPGRRGHYYVEDGNLRVTAGHTLGQKCPLLDCLLSKAGANKLQQGLNMVTANKVRRKGDPISEARHYQRLMQAHGLTVAEIVRRTGLSRAHIDNCLIWLQLEDEIQTLVLEGRLPGSAEVARALLTLRGEKRRVKYAQMLASTSATIKMIEDFCRRMNERRCRARASTKTLTRPASLTPSAGESTHDERLATPAITLAMEACGQPDSEADALPWAGIRMAAQRVCQACDLYETDLKHGVPEPAWSLLAHVANQTCSHCPLPKLRSVCGGCPSVELLKRLIGITSGEVAHDCP